MKSLLLGLLFLASQIHGQTLDWLAPVGENRIIDKVVVTFANNYSSYLSSTPTYGSFQTGANVISVNNISIDAQAPTTGLTYDLVNDLFIVKNTSNTRFFDRAFSLQRTFTVTTGQAIAFDSPNNRLINVLTNIRQYNGTTEALIETLALPSVGFTPDEGCFYDYLTGTLYLSSESTTTTPQRRLQRVGEVWTVTEQSWFNVGGPYSRDYATGRSASLLAASTFLVYRDYAYPSLNVLTARSELAAMDGTNGEQILLDPRDATQWRVFPGWFHGAIVNGEGLFHSDPFFNYQTKVRFPGMVRYDEFDLAGGQIYGSYGNQVVVSSAPITSSVFDWASNTLQQTPSNWTGGTFEFRGSSTAPTTSSTAATDYLPLVRYVATQSNQGWGSTPPGAWQSTPTTDRYMQYRVLGSVTTTPAVTWTPQKNLYPDLKISFECNSTGNMYYTPWDIDRVPRIINIANMVPGQASNNDFTQTVTSQQPIFVTNRIEMLTANRSTVLESLTPIATDQIGEFTIVAARNVNTSYGLFVTINNTASNNSQFRINHTRSSDTPANTIGLTFIDDAGSSTTFGFTDTSTGTYTVLSFSSDGATITMYQDKVAQTVTVTGAASNTGQWIGDLTGINRMATGYNHSLSGFSGQTSVKYIGYSKRPLTTQERSDMYDYLVSKGIR